ncbi:MAG: malate dehydrogenase (quinone) [Phormidesmis priestleyi Ana]|uniref:malate dehydrogenase (quinone) n=1 Tax=Phormidesmis priestleyi Ana TaxID=1666911 RepID=A0A0P7ZNJ6_9CYAN|nr:MAG: malate dehydrogenase (quinone) [Phormidesmis priestleyi Ana]
MVETKNIQDIYDVAIIGGGVCGTALLYSLSNYTNVGKIALIEKNAEVALVNSKYSSNSQTLHFGDIETNYSLEKATRVNEAATMVKQYVLKHDPNQEIYTKYHKMVLAVGEEEADFLRERYETFKDLFPDLKLIERKEIAEVEPHVVEGRTQADELVALSTPDGYAIDYQRLSQSFVSRSVGQNPEKVIDLMMGTKVSAIAPKDDHYVITANGKTIEAKAVAVTSGAHSLLFAKSLGYGQDYALLSAAGSFYFAPASLKGKVYMVQMKKLPFAAIHGDPEVHDASQTRFGPTAKVLPMLERHQYGTIFEYFKTAGLSWDAFRSFFAILSDLTILGYMIMNFIYDFPVVGKFLFIRKVRKIVPSIRFKDLKFARGYGGIRPQIVNLRSRKLEMGEAKILGENILFNITPSPGASTCLKTAEEDTRRLITFLGKDYWFDQAGFVADLTAEH